MKTIKLLVLFILSSVIIKGENVPECIVRLSKNDCSTCYNYLVFLKAINPLIKIRFVMNNTSPEDSADFFSTVVRIKEKYSIVFSDSIYERFGNEIFSTILFITDGKLICKIPLTELPQNLNKINKFYFSDSLTIFSKLSSDYSKMRVTDRGIYLFRMAYSDLTVISFKNLKKIKVYKTDDRFTKIAYTLFFPNQPDRFDKTKEKLEAEGKVFSLTKMRSFNVYNDTVLILANTYYSFDTILYGENTDIRIRGKKQNVYFQFSVLYKIFNDSIISSNIVEDPGYLGEKTSSNYYGIHGDEFSINDNYLYINFSGEAKKKENTFLGKWQLTDNRWKFLQPLPIYLPLLHQKQEIGYNYLDMIIHYPNLIFQVTLEIYNIEKLTSTLLGGSRFPDLTTVPVKINFVVEDFIVKDDVTKFVYFRDENIYLGVFKKKNLLIEKWLFHLPKPQLQIPIVFEDENTIAYYSSEQNSLIRIRIK